MQRERVLKNSVAFVNLTPKMPFNYLFLEYTRTTQLHVFISYIDQFLVLKIRLVYYLIVDFLQFIKSSLGVIIVHALFRAHYLFIKNSFS